MQAKRYKIMQNNNNNNNKQENKCLNIDSTENKKRNIHR